MHRDMDAQKVSFSMRVPAVVRREGRWFYSSCPVLDVHSQGHSEEESLNNLIEALQLFVETCYEQGSLEQVLRAQGFEPPEEGEVNDDSGALTVDVPLALIARQHAQTLAG